MGVTTMSSDSQDELRDKPDPKSPRGERPNYTLACGGTEDDPHMVEMEFNPDAATPHWVCPECGSTSWVHEQQVRRL
jgi:hypothetical protein